MKHYKVFVQTDARDDLRKCIDYLLYIKKNRQAAQNLLEDFHETLGVLANIAGSVRDPESEMLNTRKLKRLNFRRHNYFLLFSVENDIVTVTNIFHFLEDFEKKL